MNTCKALRDSNKWYMEISMHRLKALIVKPILAVGLNKSLPSGGTCTLCISLFSSTVRSV
ncbi:hypothetical protein V1478_002855 [Vespula squamosa]|uniref:Uncharacterized protein n=1 Tax=Vespula squamosa TaxID=30214 RepID=A0ABD2BR07_VESSQ